jgi:hypothetical protein
MLLGIDCSCILLGIDCSCMLLGIGCSCIVPGDTGDLNVCCPRLGWTAGVTN